MLQITRRSPGNPAGGSGNAGLKMGLDQKNMTERTGLSPFTIKSFGQGHGIGLSISSFMALLHATEQ